MKGSALILVVALTLVPGTGWAADEPSPRSRAPLFYKLEGTATQGGLMIGRANPYTEVSLDGKPVMVAPDGTFAIAFARDHGLTAELEVAVNRGPREWQRLFVAPRLFDIQRIEGVAQRYVEPSPADMARIEEERRLIREARAVRRAAADFARGFIWPVTGPISGVYGSQRVFNGQPRAPHLGVDIAAPRGTVVKAAADGVVALAGPDLFFNGNVIIIDHGLGLTTVYAHLDEFAVKQGARVKQGAPIGKVGASGRVTGPHLHWGANLGGVGVDPQLLVGPMPNDAVTPR